MIEGQETKLSRASGMHSMAVDSIHDEYFVGNSFAQAILAYRGSGRGNTPPLRIIQGPHTRLDRSGRLAVDPVNNELVVWGDGSVMVFRREANGDEAPVRTIAGPNAQFGGGDSGIAVDAATNVIVVGQGPAGKGSGSLLIFNRTAEGNVAPIGVISGPKTGLTSANQIQIYAAKREIIVAVPGVGERGPDYVAGAIAVWSLDDRGDVPPRAIITGPNSGLIRPRGVAINPQNKEIFVADMARNALLTFSLPGIF